MIIKSVKYKNFRQFEEEGKIYFDTNGKISIVYGETGAGKSTLHQLFNWILYGSYQFNQTAERDLCNLHAASLLKQESYVIVYGEIEFLQNDEEYVVRREWKYYKYKSGKVSHKEDEDYFAVQMKSLDGTWKVLENPEVLISNVLPRGLSTYFFFDGETMIADLKKKGSESAKNLQSALYSIFDLELYEYALRDLGTTNKSQSVIGQIIAKKTKELENSSTEKDREKFATDIKKYRHLIDARGVSLQNAKERVNEIEDRIKEISEQIGQQQSKSQIEAARKTLVDSNKNNQDSIYQVQKSFGKMIVDKYSLLLVAQVVEDASKRLSLEVQDEENKIIPGLTKELLINLLKATDKKCICGNCLTEKEIEAIETWKSFFPPTSYKAIYDKFNKTAAKYSREYNDDELMSYLKRVINIKQTIKETENRIEELDKTLKETGDIDYLVDERRQLEKELREKKIEIDGLNSDITNYNHQVEIREKRLAKNKNADKIVAKYDEKIKFINQIIDAIQLKMKKDTEEYSLMLKNEIKALIERMLTSKRDVELDDEFILRVKDSFDSEAKSEGQFAVVSFAYVGGVLNVVKKHEKLRDKEFPLVLDGPFSKLDEKQKKNVIDELPQFATQVIIFSKDNLEDWLDPDYVGAVWSIKSNDEKNNAVIEEGSLWK